MGNREPLVTVISLVYNTGNYVVEALQSIKNQSYTNIQHIIIDDCSVDNSLEIVETWIKENNYLCEIVKHKKNLGVCKSLNDGLKRAKGEFINFVSDDLFLPGKIKQQVEIFSMLNDKIGIVYGDLTVINDKGDILYPSFYKWYLKFLPPKGNVLKYYFDQHPIHLLGALIKKSVFDSIGYFDENLIYEDWDLGLRLAREFEYYYQDEVVALWRKHDKQMTSVYWQDKEKYSKVLLSEFKMFSKHLDLKEHRKEILNKLYQRFIKLSEIGLIGRSKEISLASYLFKSHPRPLSAFIFIGSLFNKTLKFNEFYFRLNSYIKRK